jgi:hypothetical protein
MPDWQLRLHIIPMLENAGLIKQEADLNDKRKILIYPIATYNVPALDKGKTIVSERVG